MKPVLITDDVHPLLADGLRQLGFGVDENAAISRAQVLATIHIYEGLVINSRIAADKELLQAATQLKWVCRAGSGLEVIDQEVARKQGIYCFNSPEGNRNAVAEQALGMLLALLRHLHTADAEVRKGKWLREPNRGEELFGKTVALIGYGNTAQSLAQRLRGFETRILALDKYKSNFGNHFVTEATWPQIYEEAEVVSLHLPLTAETHHLIADAFFNAMQRPFYFINTSRGKVVDTAALLHALQSGRVKAAALDVLENENLHALNSSEQQLFQALVSNKKVLLTPHVAGWTVESKKRIAEVLLQKIAAFHQSFSEEKIDFSALP